MNTTSVKQAIKILQLHTVPLALFFSIVIVQVVKAELGISARNTTLLAVNIFLFLCFAISIVFPRSRYYEVFRRIVTFGVPFTVLLVLLGIYTQTLFIDRLAIEDGPVENLSAAASLAASVLWFMFALGSLIKRNWRLLGVSIVLGTVLAIIGFEEISWGQRLFGIESNDFFLRHNMQGEMNLHNIDTYMSEKIFYTMSVVCLVIIPFYRDTLESIMKKIKLSWLEEFLPSRWILLPFSVVIGLAGGVLTSSITVLFVSVFSLVILLFEADRLLRGNNKWQAIGRIMCALLLVITPLAIINFDFQSIGARHWLGSEYLEMFIGVGLLVYTLDFMFRSTKFLSASRSNGSLG